MQHRKVSLDFLRIFAIFFVIYTHIGYNCETMFAPASSSLYYWISCVLGVFCRVAVPIFFMISGGLLLNKKEPYAIIFKKRVLRFGIVLVVFSALIYLLQWNNHSIPGFVTALYSFKAAPSLWYLYSYIELLLLLPLLRKLAQAMTAKDYLYYFILQIVFVTLLPVFETVTGFPPINLSIVITVNNIFYFMMGHFFVNIADKTFYSKKNLLLINTAGLIFIAGACLYLTKFFTQNGNVTTDETPLFTFIAVPTFAVFFDVKYVFDRINVKKLPSKILQEAGTASFGVYLIQGIFIKHTEFISDFFCMYFPPVISGLVYTLIVMFVCTVIIIPIRKIPLINKLI